MVRRPRARRLFAVETSGLNFSILNAFYSDTFVLPLPEHHRFPMAKCRLVRERLLAERVLSADDLQHTRPDRLDRLAARARRGVCRRRGEGRARARDAAPHRLPWSPMMVERSRRSVGATLAGAREAIAAVVGDGLTDLSRDVQDALKGVPYSRKCNVAANLAGGTHHAFRDRGEGSAFSTTSRSLRRSCCATVRSREPPSSTATCIRATALAAIFSRRAGSLHPRRFTARRTFPFRKEVSDLDLTFADGARRRRVLAALADHLPRVLDRHRPDVVFYLAGADPYESDRLGPPQALDRGAAGA